MAVNKSLANTPKKLRRYTNLAATIHLLRNQCITLLDPAQWDDKNDAYAMEQYKIHMNARSVLALCFARGGETYHHWRVFSHGSDGVSIEFDRQELLSAFASDDNIEIGNVCYKWIRELREELREVQIDFGQLPFLKRAQFKDEKELRIVYINIEEYVAYKEYPIKIEWIKRIALSPWMPKPLVGSVKDTLKSINEKCSDIQVTQSYLVDNETWQDLISTRAAPLLQSAVSDSLTPKKE